MLEIDAKTLARFARLSLVVIRFYSTMKIDKLIDRFVDQINKSEKEKLEPNEVPFFLRSGEPDEYGDYDWKICESDCKEWVDPLMHKLPKRFPPSFYSLLSRYAFPAFEFSSIMLFANTGKNSYWELTNRIFLDQYMSTFLLNNGYIQFGNQYYGSYDPVCFDINRKRSEHPIVLIDHAWINHRVTPKISIIDEIAASFIDLVENHLKETCV